MQACATCATLRRQADACETSVRQASAQGACVKTRSELTCVITISTLLGMMATWFKIQCEEGSSCLRHFTFWWMASRSRLSNVEGPPSSSTK